MEYLDTAYLEHVNGRWEAWTYSAGCRVYIGHDSWREVLAARMAGLRYRVTYV